MTTLEKVAQTLKNGNSIAVLVYEIIQSISKKGSKNL